MCRRVFLSKSVLHFWYDFLRLAEWIYVYCCLENVAYIEQEIYEAVASGIGAIFVFLFSAVSFAVFHADGK